MPRCRNGGLRKRCGCPRRNWAKCPHAWHFSFKWTEVHYRFSLERELGRRIESKTVAEAEADGLRTAIRNGTFRVPTPPSPAQREVLAWSAFGEVWKKRRGSQLVRPRDNEYRLAKINAFVLPDGAIFGDKPLDAITTDDIEAFRDARKAAGLSAVTVNHDLKLLRKMFNWGIRKGYLQRTPFKIGTEPAITLEKEIPRAKRFEHEEDEQKLLDAADPYLRGVIIALLDTACRLGEILSLQWRDVNLERRELTVQAVKAKTRTARIVPISTRLLATLEMRQLDPSGKQLGPDAYVFGNELGERYTSVRAPWEEAREEAGLRDLQLRDLRHEAGSRFDEAGVSVNYVSKLLGHASLSTTTRYLNIQRRGLHLAMEKLEASRRAAEEQSRKKAEEEKRAKAASVAHSLHTDDESAPAFVPELHDGPTNKQLPS